MNYNQNTIQNPKTFFRLITIIYSALLIGQVLFGIVAYSIAINPFMSLVAGKDLFFYMIPVFAVVTGIIGIVIYKKLLGDISGMATLKEKLSACQTALIIRFALSQGASMLAIVSFVIKPNLYYLVIAGLNILYFLSMRPTKSKMEEELNLSYEEKMEME